MGDNFLEGQAKNTKKRRARAVSQMETPKLFERPDEVVDEFTIDCRDGQTFAAGEILFCFPNSVGDSVDVARNHEHIGCVRESGGAKTLRIRIDGPGVGKLLVRSFNQLACTAQVEAVQD